MARAPGSPPTGQTNSTPRDSILPSTYLLVRLDQRFAIDPCSPSLLNLAVCRVISLEPRTPHQPEKLQKLSKNEYVFTPSIFRVKQKLRAAICLLLQSSAGRPQGGDAEMVQDGCGMTSKGPILEEFCGWQFRAGFHVSGLQVWKSGKKRTGSGVLGLFKRICFRPPEALRGGPAEPPGLLR